MPPTIQPGLDLDPEAKGQARDEWARFGSPSFGLAAMTFWPRTYSDEWCGEWQAKAPAVPQ